MEAESIYVALVDNYTRTMCVYYRAYIESMVVWFWLDEIGTLIYTAWQRFNFSSRELDEMNGDINLRIEMWLSLCVWMYGNSVHIFGFPFNEISL